jgi:hypothetical protein
MDNKYNPSSIPPEKKKKKKKKKKVGDNNLKKVHHMKNGLHRGIQLIFFYKVSVLGYAL